MNKNDLTLIIIVTIISLITILLLVVFEDKTANTASVYYKNTLVLSIDLSIKDETKYEVEGENGTVTIIAKDGKIKVDTENSPLHLCSKQGYISKSYETIICLPNKITIKIESNDELDTIVK